MCKDEISNKSMNRQTVVVLFFAQLREQLNCDKLELEIADELTLTQLIQTLLEQQPGWQKYLNNSQLMMAVNQSMAHLDSTAVAGDEVAFFPPVTGG